MQKKRTGHDYTNELELKSLLIRIKNKRTGNFTDESIKTNRIINRYIKTFIKINNTKYSTVKEKSKRTRIKNKMKLKIVKLSEKTKIDGDSYERFGEIILLMIKNILKKPQFSGYTYKDDFYSDAIHKILKYLHNFDHTKISERTGQPVNAFAYISQYIHNSVLFIIDQKKKENNKLKHHVMMESLDHNLNVKYNHNNESTYDEMDKEIAEKTVVLHECIYLYDEVLKYKDDTLDRVTIMYPADYRISFEEYDSLKILLKGNITIKRTES